MRQTIEKGRWYPDMPPMLDGEDSNRYTNRLLGAYGDEMRPYDHHRNRQCSTGWHEECSDPAGEQCKCPCHHDPTAIGLSPVYLRQEKSSVLALASRLTTDKAIPEAVTANAAVLQKWMEAASSTDDRKDRLAALERADHNRDFKRKADDDPHRLISEAETYYAFIKAA